MNTCPHCAKSLNFYDGVLGYEAIYCGACGWFADHENEGQSDFFKKVNR
jgi:hypothetical protein